MKENIDLSLKIEESDSQYKDRRPLIKLLKGLVSQQTCDKMVDRFEKNIKNMRIETPDNRKGISAYSVHELYDDIQAELLFPISESSEKVLIPTYNFSRKYTKGSILRRHSDRTACEYSVTLCFGVDKKPWTFYCEVEGKEKSIDLEPGDALYYRGMHVPHWREPLETEYCYQTFLHYIDLNGMYTGDAFEGIKRQRDNGGIYGEPYNIYKDIEMKQSVF